MNLPIFLAMTDGLTVSEQRGLAVRIVVFSAIMCAIILLGGNQILAFFGITVDQFRIAGGLVLGHIAWTMLNGSENAAHHVSQAEKPAMRDVSGLAFYPITFPMIVGPGTIATLIIYASHAKGYGQLLEVAAVAGVVLALLFVVLFLPLSSARL